MSISPWEFGSSELRERERESYVMGNGALRSLSLSYAKKDWWTGLRQCFFGYGTDYKIVLWYLHRLYTIVGVIPKGMAACQSFFYHDNDKDLKSCFAMTQLTERTR